MSDYGFEVLPPLTDEENDLSENWRLDPTTWVVRLPHSCSHWVIADSEDRAEAVADLESFIAQAQTALEQLRTLAAVPDA